MGSTSFKFGCPTCGRRVNWDHYWSHVLRCLKKAGAPAPVSPSTRLETK